MMVEKSDLYFTRNLHCFLRLRSIRSLLASGFVEFFQPVSLSGHFSFFQPVSSSGHFKTCCFVSFISYQWWCNAWMMHANPWIMTRQHKGNIRVMLGLIWQSWGSAFSSLLIQSTFNLKKALPCIFFIRISQPLKTESLFSLVLLLISSIQQT